MGNTNYLIYCQALGTNNHGFSSAAVALLDTFGDFEVAAA